MWKERLWQVFLVAILGLVLTMYSRSSSNNNTSSSGVLNAEGTTTVNVGPSAISHTMFCSSSVRSGSNRIYYYCDASDDTVFPETLYTDGITHDAAFAAGWKLVGPGCSTGASSRMCYLFHK